MRMKNIKQIIITMVSFAGLILLLSHSYAGEIKFSYDFRKTNWGMTQDQVKASELDKPAVQSVDVLVYYDNIAQLKAEILYNFTDTLLTAAIYKIKVRHTNSNAYIEDFNKLKKLLNKKYSAPITDKKIWKKDLYRDDPSQYGFAISLGHLLYITQWQNSDTEITIFLNGNNYKNSLVIAYQGLKYKNKVENQNEKEELNKL